MTCKLISYDSPFLESLNIAESEVGKVNAYIEAASAAIEKATHRKFEKAQYDEVYEADDSGSLVLRNFPLISVDRVFSTTREALRIENTESTVTNANYSTTKTALLLSHTESGTVTSTELLFADYPTIALLRAAIVAVGNGWSASVAGDYGPFASVDLVADQYGDCKTISSIRIWGQTGASWTILDNREALINGEFYRGQAVRIVYTAGFAANEIPDDLKHVCAELVASMMGEGDGAIQSESLGGYSYSLATGAVERLPRTSREILASYKDRVA